MSKKDVVSDYPKNHGATVEKGYSSRFSSSLTLVESHLQEDTARQISFRVYD